MLTGSCLCGACAFKVDAPAGPANYSHCNDCRRSTGSAFNIGVRVPADAFEVVSGRPRRFTKAGESGGAPTRHFCSKCGSPLFTSSPGHPEWLFIKAGVIDDRAVVAPIHESWTQSEVSWARIPSDLPKYPRGRGS